MIPKETPFIYIPLKLNTIITLVFEFLKTYYGPGSDPKLLRLPALANYQAFFLILSSSLSISFKYVSKYFVLVLYVFQINAVPIFEHG